MHASFASVYPWIKLLDQAAGSSLHQTSIDIAAQVDGCGLHLQVPSVKCRLPTPGNSSFVMAVGALLEPLTVVSLLFGGAWLNRDKEYCFKESQATWAAVDGVFKKNDEFGKRNPSPGSVASWSFDWSLSASPTLLGKPPKYRSRKLRLFGHETTVTSPNTLIFKDRLLSRVLRKFPFLVEVWYWALIYWVYQLGRAFTALTMMEDTVKTARRHALQVIRLERRLNIFREPPIQQFFLRRPALMHWINRIYSFIHIPGTILFLVVLYYLATVPRHRAAATDRVAFTSPALYEARRRAMAVCNLLAFAIFTLWPCMPPRLLSDPLYDGDNASEAKSYGFVDTVHGPAGESSVWTSNKFCNQHGQPTAPPSHVNSRGFPVTLTG